MNEQLVRQITNLQRELDALETPEISSDLISPYLALPGLRGFWPMSAFDSSGDAQDQSGHNHELAYNGNPTYNYTGLVPYIDLDGTGDYLSRPDEADLDISGTETYVAGAARGLTMGGWFRPITHDADYECIIGKNNAGAPDRSYWIDQGPGPGYVARFVVSVDGTAQTTLTMEQLTVNTWEYVVVRFTPSIELAGWVRGIKYTTVAGIPASIANTGSAFTIGAFGAGSLPSEIDASLCFLCAAALSDAQISSLYQQTRGAFGV